ncbi:MAG: hypothetical protein GXP42_19250 [Chloroflexi bacterium]|nr:hypothetical protein [Chloroflexota bacterium]
MNRESTSYIRIIARRWWLLLLLPLVTASVIFALSRTTETEYLASERLQIIIVDPQEVPLFSKTLTTITNDQIQTVHDQFYDVLRFRSVAWRTIADLGLNMSADELIERIDSLHQFDFITVYARMPSPELAQEVVRVHTDNAIETYRKIRATPAQISLDFIEQQLVKQAESLANAQEALQSFQLENEISDLNREILAYQDLLRATQQKRDAAVVEAERNSQLAEEFRNLAQENAARAETLRASLAVTETVGAEGGAVAAETDAEKQEGETGAAPEPDPAILAEIDALTALAQDQRRQAEEYAAIAAGHRATIAEFDRQLNAQEQQLVYLLGLQKEYNRLVDEVNREQATYSFLTDKANEARLKLSQGQDIGYLQVIDPPRLPESPLPSRTLQLMLVGVVISLLVAVILAFLLEALENALNKRSTPRPAHVRE